LPLAESVAKGTPVDWTGAPVASQPAPSAREVEAMRAIETIAKAHSTWLAADDTTNIDDAPTRKWRHLEVGPELGRGTFGVVYRAVDDKLGHAVALKLLNSDVKTSAALKEARLMTRVRHPHVVTVHGADVVGDRVGVWMELVTGHTLEDLLARQGRFGAHEAATIGLDLAGALSAVHGAGLVHRDVKARNVVREDGGRIVLMDFSAGEDLADLAASAPSADRPRAAGTPLYAAPEIFDGAAPTPRADLYSLGVLLYHLVTGEYPVPGRSAADVRSAHQRGERRRLRDARADLPEGFVGIVERALSASPDDRFESAGAFGDALSAFLGQPRQAPVPPVPLPAPGWRRPPIAIAALLAAALVGWIATRSPREPQPVRLAEAAAPTPSVPATPLTYDIRATFHRRDRDVDVPLRAGARVVPGERLTLTVQSSTSSHVYVVNQDDRGAAFLMFPLPGQKLTNPLPPNVAHRIPGRPVDGGDEVYWQVTTAGGREHFFVFASPEPQTLFEQMLAVLPSPSADAPVESVPLSAEQLGTLRGVGGLVRPERTPTTPSLSFPFAKPLADGPETVQGLWARQITFENPPRSKR
jgi:serine/threonine-protein kinase